MSKCVNLYDGGRAVAFGALLLLAGCGGDNSPSAVATQPSTPPTTPSNPTQPANPVPTVLAASVSTLALSVNDTALNPALTGVPRAITVTNTGSAAAVDVNYSVSPALPAGTTVSSTCLGTIAVGASCTITLTPGTVPTALPGDTNPSPVAISISGSNTNTLASAISVLGYGSVYQGGYIFSIDDTTPTSGSIAGTVTALADTVNGQWSALISTSAQSLSLVDGRANTQLIVSAVGVSSAAASCAANTTGGYADWYLPAVCEMGYDANGSGSGCGASPGIIQNIQSNLIDNGQIAAISGLHWSSTEYQADPLVFAYAQDFETGGSSGQSTFPKFTVFLARCVRAISN